MERPLLILDLDETLLHAAEVDLPWPEDFMVASYRVHVRPHLEEFLETVSAHYRLAVWTSSGEDYARYVTDRLGLVPRLEFLWSRLRCTRRLDPEFRDFFWVKDLRKVKRRGYDLRRVLVVDDTPKKLCRHYGNLVRVAPFEGDPADDELRHLAAYLVEISREENFRTLEKRRWRWRKSGQGT